MIDIIKNALKEAEIKTWRINEKKEHTAEVFFIRRRQDMQIGRASCRERV